MTITAYGTGAYRAAKPQSFTSARAELTDLERQLATQKKAESYGDLGIDRRTSLDINAKLSTLESWLGGIQRGDVNLKIATKAVENFAKMTSETVNDTRSNSYVPSSTGRSAPQILAEEKFKQTLDLLNSDVNGRHLFSGLSSDVTPTAGFDEIINGSAGKAGLKQMVDEQRRADLGTAGLGRLTTGMVGTTTIALADGDHGYGFKIANVASTGTGIATAAQTPLPAGTRAAYDVTVAGQPAAGDTLTITLNLPDGTQEQVRLTARAAGTTASNTVSFEIGADPDATAANLKISIDAALRNEAQTTLSASSSQVAADSFFSGSLNNPPARITGPDFENATAAPTKVGAIDTTVIWYRGEDGIPPLAATDPALDTRTITVSPTGRSTSSVQIDQSQIIGTGARANEEVFRVGLAQFAVLTIENFPAGATDSQARYEAMITRVSDQLGFGGDVQKPAEIITEFGSAQTAMARAKERHESTKNYLTTTLAGVENVTTEEVAVQILALQTRLQASYQTTAILSKLSLTNYL